MKVQISLLLLITPTLTFGAVKLAPVDLYQDLGSFYCGKKRRTCEHYSENSAFLIVKKNRIELARNFHESDLPLTFGYSGKLVKSATKVVLRPDKDVADRHIKLEAGRSPRQEMDENSKGDVQVELACDQSRKSCRVTLTGNVTYKGEKADWMSKVDLDCNRTQLNDETLPAKEFEKACAEIEE